MLKVIATGADRGELDNNARQIALYNAIFVGYPEANGIPKAEPLARPSLYDEKLAEFDKLITDPATPAKYNMVVTNHPSIPISKVSKKLIEGPVIVAVNTKAIRRDLEEKGYLPSLAVLGYKPSVCVFPDEAWLIKKQYYTTVANQGTEVKIWKYREAVVDPEFKIISDNFKSKFDKFFEIKSIADALDARANEDFVNNQSADGTYQSVESKLFSTLSPDLVIRIDILMAKVSGGNRATITLKCIDPFSSMEVINGQPMTRDSREDELNTTKASFMGAVDDIYPRIVDYFITRESNGAQGNLSVEIAGNLAGTLDFETPIQDKDKETNLARIIKTVLAKNVQKGKNDVVRHELDGLADKTRLAYKKVFIPIYYLDPDTETKEKNTFVNLGKAIQSKLKSVGISSTVISLGMGTVKVRITEKI